MLLKYFHGKKYSYEGTPNEGKGKFKWKKLGEIIVCELKLTNSVWIVGDFIFTWKVTKCLNKPTQENCMSWKLWFNQTLMCSSRQNILGQLRELERSGTHGSSELMKIKLALDFESLSCEVLAISPPHIVPSIYLIPDALCTKNVLALLHQKS